MKELKRVWIGIGWGALVTPMAIFLSVVSVGNGHDSFDLAKAFFPLPMLMTGNGSIGFIQLLFAFIQFPLYGAVIGRFKSPWILAAILVAHGILIPLAFSLLPNFS